MPQIVGPEISSMLHEPKLKPEADERSWPLPRVQIFDAATADIDDIVAAMIEAGGCIIRNTTSAAALAEIETVIRPYIQIDGDWNGDFFPKETKRVMGLIGKSPSYVKHVVQNEIALSVANRFLTSTYKCWVGNELKTFISKPQLNNTITFSIAPGARDQELHRDDMIHHNLNVKRRKATEYKIGDDCGVGFFIAGKKSTMKNGATRFIPGSHLWDLLTPPDESLSFYAELEPGDAFIFLSSCFHGGSANRTTDQERLMYSCFYTKGFLRQEENQYLAADFGKIKDIYDDKTLGLMGYSLSPPFLGWVDIKHPLDYLRGEVGLTDLY